MSPANITVVHDEKYAFFHTNLILGSSNEQHRELLLKVQFQFKLTFETECSLMSKISKYV